MKTPNKSILLLLLLLLAVMITKGGMVEGAERMIHLNRDGSIRAATGTTTSSGSSGSGSARQEETSFKNNMTSGPLQKEEHTMMMVWFHCNLDVEFFQGQVVQAPTHGEVIKLIQKTQDWMTNLLAVNESFQMLHILHQNNNNNTNSSSEFETYYDGQNSPDNFTVAFEANAQVVATTTDNDSTNGARGVMTIHEIAQLINAANYEEYVKQYIWQITPLQHNVFWQTHGIDLECDNKSREDPDQETDDSRVAERQRRRRRLLTTVTRLGAKPNTAAFGGSTNIWSSTTRPDRTSTVIAY